MVRLSSPAGASTHVPVSSRRPPVRAVTARVVHAPEPRAPRARSRFRSTGRTVAGWVIGVGVLAWVVLNAWFVGTFYVPTGSMEPTVVPGDRAVVVSTFPGGPDRGQVVVFSDPGGWLGPVEQAASGTNALAATGAPEPVNQFLLKRVVGVGGDRVVCCDGEGRIVVNGDPVDEPYVYAGDEPSEKPFDVSVPDGYLWVLGDHRSVSADSRYVPEGVSGLVPVEDVVGRAVAVIRPGKGMMSIER